MKHYLIAGLTLLFLTNAVALSGVVYNRSGEPLFELMLSERELTVPNYWARSENSGLSLRLNWRVKGQGENKWYRDFHLSKEKFLSLGFDDIEKPAQSNWERFETEKVVYLALELNGPTYQSALNKMRQAYKNQTSLNGSTKDRDVITKAQLDNFKFKSSRLYVVDLSDDFDSLADKYSDSSMYAIVKGLVKPYRLESGYGVSVNTLLVSNLSVPLELRSQFEMLEPSYERKNKFNALISWGQRLEPWIASVELHE